jgi:hypothetical protein
VIKIIRPESYIKRERKFFKKHPELINQYAKALKLLSLAPSHPSFQKSQKINELCTYDLNSGSLK